ncbi:histidinol-phosphate transaminase [Jeotgalibacillus sp. R-1-5s-1]|uniref:histidinol-phosphate transaminase n=1 Tax=Jeotgalibacillus sp. R-1-5s-1 TaxID=2555897 RepID=UPI00106B7848|nr:histidinol-phosphate transaminase [Jeotgalibacillus sp. R-1-5s-1]TFE03215.1 histidinol-phosphate transaminase [Jeotgalibacillus sp. R-1-5s-1]
MDIKQQVRKLSPYKPGKTSDEVKREFGLTEIIKLASNENPFGCSEKVTEGIRSGEFNFALYPDGAGSILRTALVDHYGLQPEQFILGNGSDEVIQIISRALLEPGKNTVMPAPSFPQYKHNAVVEGAEVREIPLVNGAHDLDAMAEAVDSQTAVVWVCSPNNPTGVLAETGKLKAFLDKIPEKVLVVLDEAYHEYVTDEDYYNGIQLAAEYPNLIVTRTFSKAYGLAGFRVGYGISSPSVIQALEPVREPFNTSTLAQFAAAKALSDQDFIEKCKLENTKGLRQFEDFCQAFGLSYYPSQGNFILIDFKRDADELFNILLQNGLIVRSGNALGFPTSLRITVGSEEQNSKIISVLTETINS